jgi:hypothetical protein
MRPINRFLLDNAVRIPASPCMNPGKANLRFLFGVVVLPQTKCPIVDMPDTSKGLAEQAPLGSARAKPERVADLHGVKACNQNRPAQQ